LAGSAQYRCNGVADYEQAIAWHPNRIETTQGTEHMKRHLERSVLAVAVSSCLLASAPALAITNVEANAGPQFNFVNPGARSLGMGGAFIGLADDSTAAYTNPAGLAQLSKREFSIEVRDTRFNTYSNFGGRLLGTPTGAGLDTVSGLQNQDTSKDVANLSFLSFAFPLKNGTLAVYRHELANFEASFSSQGTFTQTLNGAVNPPFVDRTFPTINDESLKIVNYGFAGSWRIGSTFMLGGSLNFYQFDINSLTRRYDFDADHNGVISNQERLTVVDFSPSALRDILTQNGSDSSFGFNVGMLWLPNDKWSLGAVYRKGPDFDYGFNSISQGVQIFQGKTDFAVPDVWGIGVGYRPTDAWRMSMDVNRVNYSQHAEHIHEQSNPASVDYLKLDDSYEVRLGAEFTAINAARPYNIRFGAWHEPAHQLYFDGLPVVFTGTPLTVDEKRKNTKATQFIRGKDSYHFSAGYGIVFNKFQIDTALDLSTRSDTLSISMVYFLK
jgi:long-subunit fatty acid transport protein